MQEIDPWAVIVMAACAGLVVGFVVWLTQWTSGADQSGGFVVMITSGVIGIVAAVIGILGGSKTDA